MANPKIFISHLSSEGEIAKTLKKHLERDFKALKVFVSSDRESIKAGEQWLEALKKALGEARVEIVLCSPESVTQPWVNFEAGAGWIRANTKLIPVCHSGITPDKLPIPLNLLQGIVASDPDGLRSLYDSLANVLRKRPPEPKSTFEAIAEEICKLDRKLESVTKAGKPASKVPPLVARMRDLVATKRDPDLLLHTFLGQHPVPATLEEAAASSDRTKVFRLWADAAYGNSIHASLDEGDGVTLIRIRFTNQRGSLPGDVTIRPLGFRAIAVPKEKAYGFLVFDVRAPRSGQGNADRDEPLAIAARVIDAQATQWSYQTRDVRLMFDVPVSDSWRSIALDLASKDDWVRFDSDGNYYYAADRPDFSVIAAIVIEVGMKGAERPGPGTGELEISRIRLSTNAPADGRPYRC